VYARSENAMKVLFFDCRTCKKIPRANARESPESELETRHFWVFLSKFTIFELKSSFQKPTFGHCSPSYVCNCKEYSQIFPAPNELTKCERGWESNSERSRVRIATIICHYLTLLNYTTSTAFLEIIKRLNCSSSSIICKF
jgi:hypothetical protein